MAFNDPSNPILIELGLIDLSDSNVYEGVYVAIQYSIYFLKVTDSNTLATSGIEFISADNDSVILSITRDGVFAARPAIIMPEVAET